VIKTAELRWVSRSPKNETFLISLPVVYIHLLICNVMELRSYLSPRFEART
jgi:hypothetical protein